MVRILVCLAIALLAPRVSESQTAESIIYLSDVAESAATIGWGTLGKDVSVSGAPLRLNGVVYAKGLGTHAISDIRYDLAGRCSQFDAVVGVDDAMTLGSVRFQVFADSALLYDSAAAIGGNMTGAHPGQPVSVALTSRRELRLLVTDGGNGIGKDHADWAGARVRCAAGSLQPLRLTAFVSDLTPTLATIGWGTLGRDVSVSATPLAINGELFPKGLGTHAVSDIRYTLSGACSRFDAVVGVDDIVTRGSVRFQVLTDGSVQYDSFAAVAGNMTGAHPGQRVSVDVTGAQELRLLVTDGGNGIGSDHADWANARVTCLPVTEPPPDPPPTPPTLQLTDLASLSATIGWGTLGRNVSVYGRPLTINGSTYATGIGTHANSDIRYAIPSACTQFDAIIGVDDEVVRGSVRFQVYGDGQVLYDSASVLGRNVTGADGAFSVSVSIAGRGQLRLVVSDGGDGIGSDHADWALARMTCQASSAVSDSTFAYWNIAGGYGRLHLPVPNLANGKPFSCVSTSGALVDDSLYATGAGNAVAPSDGATRAALQPLGSDPTFVAIGVSESWGPAEGYYLADVLGWSMTNATMKSAGDVILTRYGFTEQGLSPTLGQTGTEVHKALYANVCLDEGCTRTMPFFILHLQTEQGAYDAAMAALLGYMDSIVPPGKPRIVMGDFNAWDTLTDPHLCIGSNEPGASHELGIRRIIASGYTDMLRSKNPTGNLYTGMVNALSYSRDATSCLPVAGLAQGHPYKAIDHAYSKNLSAGSIVAAQKFALPIGGFGNCAGSDHLGIKVTVRVP